MFIGGYHQNFNLGMNKKIPILKLRKKSRFGLRA